MYIRWPLYKKENEAELGGCQSPQSEIVQCKPDARTYDAKEEKKKQE
jgi:hypothetical protein